jgi:hypothetical protein
MRRKARSRKQRLGEIVWNCSAGDHSLEAIELARTDNLHSKTLIACFAWVG